MGKIGKVVQIIGPVVDVEFEDQHLPAIYNAVRINDPGAETGVPIEIVAEVEQHLGESRVRCVSMEPTDGMIRGMAAEDLGGPIRIAQMSGQAAEIGYTALIYFAAVLSINLGLINLFPVPMLDGGHLLFYAIEALRGRPLGERAQEYGFRIGLALVLTLMVFVTWNDLVRIWLEFTV